MTKIIFKFKVDKNIRYFLDSQGVNRSKIVNDALRNLISANDPLKQDFIFEFDGYLTVGLDYDIYNEIKKISKSKGIKLFYLVNIALLSYIQPS